MSNLPPPPPPPPPGRGRGQQRPSNENGNRPTGPGDGMRRPGSWPRWTMWILLGVVALALLLPSLWPDQSGHKLSYSQFMEKASAGQVASVVINNSSGTISGTLKDGSE